MTVRTAADPNTVMRTWTRQGADLYWCPDADRPPGDFFRDEPIDLDGMTVVARQLWQARQTARYGG